MYHCTYLVNRQMITDPSQVKPALSQYHSADGEKMTNFFYRLEWYRIGISIPMDVYSEKMPVLELRPECQLTHCEKLDDLPEDTDIIGFKLFAIPYKTATKNEDLDEEFLKSWFEKQLKNSAKIESIEYGPNNRLYYKTKPEDTNIKQIQSYTIRGELKCLNAKKLDYIRQKPLGYYDNLGCGLLLLE